MRRQFTAALAAAALIATLGPLHAETIVLPPSVGQSLIQQVGSATASAQVAMPISGRLSATPIEIPYLPPLIRPRSKDETPMVDFEIGAHADSFAKMPAPVEDPFATGTLAGFAFALLADDSVYGDTPHGYALFAGIGDYARFLRSR